PAVLTILRPAAVPTSDGDDYWSRVLRGRLATTFVGHDPSIQLLSPDDLGRAVACAARAGRPGVFHVTPTAVVPAGKAPTFAGTLRLPLPAGAAPLGGWAVAPVGGAPFDEAGGLRYPAAGGGRQDPARARFLSARLERRGGRRLQPPRD